MKNKTASALSFGLILLLAAAVSATTGLEAVRSLAAQGDPAAALELVEQQLSAEPEHAEGMFLKGVLLVELRRASEARGVFERLIEIEPDLPEPYNNLAVIEAAAGDYEAAVTTLRKALDTHASYRTAYDNLTKIYTQLASEAYGQALDAEPGERAEIVELVLLGNLGQPAAGRPGDRDEPRREAQLAATEPGAIAQMSQRAPVTAPAPGEPAVEESTVEQGAAGMVPEMEPEPSEPQPDLESVAPFVESWRLAWQEQRVDDYLAAYSKDFRPANGMSRQRWAEERGPRISGPEFIRVTLAYLDEPQVSGNKASIRFLQSYESNTFQDRVSKLLVLVWEDDGWKILEERAD